VYQTLIDFNATAEQQQNQLQLLPDLASNWTVSSNGQAYNFTIRPGVTFSNGDPMNSYQVWAQFYMLYDLEGNFSTFWLGMPIFNFSHVAFGTGTLNTLNQSGLVNPSSAALTIMQNSSWPVYTSGPNNVIFQTDTPFSFFLPSLTGWTGFQMDSQYIIQHGGPGAPGSPNSYFAYPPNIIPGTGPYVLTNATPGSVAVFQQYPNYWGNKLTAVQISGNPFIDPGHFKTVVVNDKSSETTRLIDLQSGQVQIASLTGSDLQSAQAQPNTYQIMQIKYPASLTYMEMNNARFPTNITLVRQAIVHAINYTAVIQVGALGAGAQYMGPEAPVFGQFYDPGGFAPYQQNLTLAASDLVSAGYPKGNGLPTMTLDIASESTYWELPAAQIIQANLQSIGIQTNIQVVPLSTEIQFVGGYSYELNMSQSIPNLELSWQGYAPDFMAPNDYWSAFVTTEGFGNYVIYNSTVVDHNVNFMYTSDNTTAIIQHLQIAQQQIYNDAPYAWLFASKFPLDANSYVWKIGTISSLYAEPNLEGVTNIPALNTIIPG
jgi:peptide/nickel transport system substrate-binding protein